jgi:hypothetical protein
MVKLFLSLAMNSEEPSSIPSRKILDDVWLQTKSPEMEDRDDTDQLPEGYFEALTVVFGA